MSQDFYNRVAKEFGGYSFGEHKAKYDTVYPGVAPEEIFKTKLIQYSGVEKNALDVGCGDCRFALAIATSFKEIVGLDNSDELLKIARQKISEQKIPNIKILQADASKTGLGNDSFDVAYSRRGPTPFAEVFRVLKPEGVFVVIEIGEKDATEIKKVFGRGQNFGKWDNPILEEIRKETSLLGFGVEFAEDYEYKEYFKSYEDLELFLKSVPIFEDFDPVKDKDLLTQYSQKFTTQKGIELPRHRVVYILKKGGDSNG